MAATFVILLTAHLIGDFVLQTAWIAREKRRIDVLLLHVLLITALSAVLLGDAPPAVLGVIFVTHLGMDFVKSRGMRPAADPDSSLWSAIGAFTVDQLFHISVLVALAVTWPGVASRGIWLQMLPPVLESHFLAGLTLICAVIAAVPAGGHVIAMLTSPLLREIEESRLAISAETGWHDVPGLRNGGRYIGWLERALVLLLILSGQPNGVGFLIAAKSILRFGDIKDAHQRRVTEYVIIGTFLSFGWAILVAALATRALAFWPTSAR